LIGKQNFYQLIKINHMSEEFVTPVQLEREVDAGIKQLKAYIEETNKVAENKVNDKIDKETFAKIETLTNELSEKSKQLEGAYEKMDVEFKKFQKEGSTKSTAGLFASEFEKSIEAKGGNIKELFKSGGNKLSLTMPNITGKAVGTMTTSASLTNEVIAADYIPSIVEIARRSMYTRQLFRQGSTSSNTMRFIREIAGEGAVATVAEGAAKPQVDRDFTAYDAPVETIAGFVRISMQLLDDMSTLRSFLPNMLQKDIREEEDSQFLYGDGSTPNLGGLSKAGNFTAFAAWTADANAQLLDLLMSAVVQLESANQAANGILLHPKDWLTMYNLKDSTNAYLRGLSIDTSTNQLNLLGVPLIKSNAVTQGQYFVADWTRNAMIFDRMGIDIRFFEQDATNVTTNLITVRAEERLAFPVLDATATIYGVIATDIAKIVNFT